MNETRRKSPTFVCAGCQLPKSVDWRVQVTVDGTHSQVCTTCSWIIARVGGTVKDK